MLNALYRLLTVTALALSFGAVGCDGAPCDKAVDKQIKFSAAEGSPVEKKMAADAEAKAGTKDGLIAVCSKIADDNAAFAARIQCQADSSDLASFKKCVTAPVR